MQVAIILMRFPNKFLEWFYPAKNNKNTHKIKKKKATHANKTTILPD